MKVLGISCSPRKGSNTEILMNEVLASAREAGAEVELVTVVGKNIAGCDGCESCGKTHRCHIEDDMQELYPKLLEADGIVLGTPVYFWGETSQAKAVMDRTFAILHGRRLRNKVSGTVVVTRRVGGTSAFSAINNFFNLHRMVPATTAIPLVDEDFSKPEGRGGGVIAYAGKKGAVTEDKPGMEEARALGRAVVRTIKSLSVRQV